MIKYNALLHGTPAAWDRNRRPEKGGADSENAATQAQGRMLDYNLGKLQETDALRDPYMASGLKGSMEAYDKYGTKEYTDQMKGAAADTAQAATDSNTAAMVRNLGRYGLNPNSGKFAGMANRNAMAGAATKAGAVNQTGIALDTAQTTAATNKWKLLNDMQTESMTQGSQIASGYGGQGQTMAQNDANQANANAGIGSTIMAGADIYQKGSAAGVWKDGGLVEEEGYADGGRARFMERGMEMAGPNAGIPAPAQPSAAEQGVGAARKGQRGMELVKEAQAGMAQDSSISAANTALADASANGTTALGLTEAGGGAAGSGSQAAMLAAQDFGLAATAGTEAAAAGTATAGTAATGALAAETTAALAAGVETAAVANAWNPIGWALGAAALFGALSLKDGGAVQKPRLAPFAKRKAMFEKAFDDERYTGTKAQDQQMLAYLQGVIQGSASASQRADLRDGGDVAGPGTATSDSIPARLSDGEFVVNAESVAIPGVRAQLEKINHAGLKQRYGEGYASGGFVDWAYQKFADKPDKDATDADKRKAVGKKAVEGGLAGNAADALRNRNSRIEAEMKRQGFKHGGLVKKEGC